MVYLSRGSRAARPLAERHKLHGEDLAQETPDGGGDGWRAVAGAPVLQAPVHHELAIAALEATPSDRIEVIVKAGAGW